ncbi:MAG: hypothetical protein UX26_C0022G0018 [Parcubacteria group bacterium GW2011_GWC1_45_9]|nr:MAG: hypothetical protein UX26_C0022G0018 [Parcubacteria group bacterium GW2011_GWC1_45_9]HCI05626.1 hypothetical protein [Patescibacteria group bacterium]
MPEKPRKNQETLDFLESLKTRLQDQNPKNFGLYMKLYKGFGREKMDEAAAVASRKFPGQTQNSQAFRYFLGILRRSETPAIKEKSATVNQEILTKYKKMKAGLKKKMTPKIQKRASLRTRIMHKAAKEERRSGRR